MNINDIVSFGPRLIGTNILFIESKTNKFMLKYSSLFYKLNRINNNNENILLFFACNIFLCCNIYCFSVCLSSLSFFLFPYQVHEKNIMFALMPK